MSLLTRFRPNGGKFFLNVKRFLRELILGGAGCRQVWQDVFLVGRWMPELYRCVPGAPVHLICSVDKLDWY